MPGSVWLRQRLDRVGGAMLEWVDDLSVRLDLGRASPVAQVFAYLQERLVVQPRFASG